MYHVAYIFQHQKSTQSQSAGFLDILSATAQKTEETISVPWIEPRKPPMYRTEICQDSVKHYHRFFLVYSDFTYIDASGRTGEDTNFPNIALNAFTPHKSRTSCLFEDVSKERGYGQQHCLNHHVTFSSISKVASMGSTKALNLFFRSLLTH